ncbi:hypothetical protein H8R18_00425 [Nanchangia anserum]|uniref:Uncharacterized protein n=1 Tax=Nanchangia anserum TaxID=2692125 RepID=A0A8I0GF60_9ACTO|nr:hypothetical protein [Nanchangia anserum]MBD3689712.1 hypothetical protein [Nanchangia anserum]QOX81886.1 hypothetical protein H8R18_00425 [Nanchangia anserum]
MNATDNREPDIARALARIGEVCVALAALCVTRLPSPGLGVRLACGVIAACLLLIVLAAVRVACARGTAEGVGMSPATIINVAALVGAVCAGAILLTGKTLFPFYAIALAYVCALAAVLVCRDNDRTWPDQVTGWVQLLVYPALGAVIGIAPAAFVAPVLAQM